MKKHYFFSYCIQSCVPGNPVIHIFKNATSEIHPWIAIQEIKKEEVPPQEPPLPFFIFKNTLQKDNYLTSTFLVAMMSAPEFKTFKTRTSPI